MRSIIKKSERRRKRRFGESIKFPIQMCIWSIIKIMRNIKFPIMISTFKRDNTRRKNYIIAITHSQREISDRRRER